MRHAQRPQTLGIDPRLVVVFELGAPVSAAEFRKSSLRVVDSSGSQIMVAFGCWRSRHGSTFRNVSAYDALYLAAADAFEVPLLTSDGRLARAPNPGIAIQHLRIG